MADYASALEEITGIAGWDYVDGPESGVGSEFWLAAEGADANGWTAYVCNDQGHVTVSAAPYGEEGEAVTWEGAEEELPRGDPASPGEGTP